MKTYCYKIYDQTKMRVISKSTTANSTTHAYNKIRLIENTNNFQVTLEIDNQPRH